MAADPTIAKVFPGLVIQGEPGAQKNRDQLYRAVQAVEFDAGGGEYVIPMSGTLSSAANFPVEIVFPLRVPESDEGQGHWFVDGQKLEVEFDIELVANPTVEAASLYVGPVWNDLVDIGTTTVTDALTTMRVDGGHQPYINFGLGLSQNVPQQFRGSCSMTALGPQTQWLRFDQFERYDGVDEPTVGSDLKYPNLAEYTRDFSGTTARSLYLMCTLTSTTGAALSTDVRLRRVSAFITGIPGKNE